MFASTTGNSDNSFIQTASQDIPASVISFHQVGQNQAHIGAAGETVSTGLFTISTTTQSYAGLFSNTHTNSHDKAIIGSQHLSAMPSSSGFNSQFSSFTGSSKDRFLAGSSKNLFTTSASTAAPIAHPFSKKNPEAAQAQSSRKRTSQHDFYGVSDQKDTKKKFAGPTHSLNHGKEASRRLLVRAMPGTARKSSALITSKERLDRRKSSHVEGSGYSRRIRRLSSSVSPQEDTISIQCTKIPREHNNLKDLRQHFERFGKVIRARPNLPKFSATVQFSAASEAAHAKEKGKNFYGSSIHIYFYKSRTQSTDKSPNQTGLKQDSAKVVPKSRPTLSKRISSVISVQSKSLQAKNDVDKLAILDKIDKILRAQTVKQSDLSKATVSKGTCPDMCPEKERYLRSQKNLLSPYETDSRKRIDHSLVVKEYSRSSADQEEPLPHELRPSPVLRITMDYLITHVMREIDYEKTAEWYDFIWNRTRAIRKEISIQQANDPYAIEVTEECARFHICCAHELCEADLTNFDPKINNENLEKTMKTVLDMYQDVHLRNPDSNPPNEAEFRAYFILLNINRSSDVLRAVKIMRPEIRYSDHVRLAVTAFSAIHSSNYSRFFSIVRQATYLQAALLHRYFNQVRQVAVRIMAKAYSSTLSTLPADDVIRRLCFNNVADLDVFCACYGIELSDGKIKLDKTVDYIAEGLSPVCSREVSEKMRGSSLGEIIASGRRPSPKIHRPTSSFDQHGYYIGAHAGLLSQTSSAAKTESSGESTTSSVEAEQEKLHRSLREKGISNESVKNVTKQLFIECISEATSEIATTEIQEAEKDSLCDHLSTEILDEATDKLLRGVVSNVILSEKMEIEKKQREAEEAEKRIREAIMKRQEEEKKRLKEEKERKEKADAVRRISEEASIKLENEKVTELISEIAREIWREERLNHFSFVISNQLLDSFTVSFTHDIARDVRKMERKAKQGRLLERFKIASTRIRLNKWCAGLEKIRFYRRSCQLFPCTSLSRNIHQQIRVLLPVSRENADDYKTRRPRLSMEPLTKLFDDHARLFETVEEKMPHVVSIHYDALPFNRIVFDNFAQTHCDVTSVYSVSPTTFWKVVLASPSINDPGTWQTWIQHKFGLRKAHSSSCQNEIVTSESFSSPEDPPSFRKTCVCCKMLTSEERFEDDLFGTSSLVIMLTKKEESDVIGLKAYLKKLFSSLRPVPSLSVLILLCDVEFDEDELLKDLEILMHPVISSVRFMELHEDDFARNGSALSSSVTSLVAATSLFPKLKITTLRTFVEKHLLNSYIGPMYKYMDCLEYPETEVLIYLAFIDDPLTQDPHSIREVYNKVLDDICACLTEESLLNISWPANEFRVSPPNADDELSFPCKGWNTQPMFDSLKTIFHRLKLPALPQVHSCEYIEEIEQLFAQYCEQVCPTKRHLTLSIMKSIESFAVSNKIEDVPTFIYCFPWQRLIDAIASSIFEDVLFDQKGGSLVAFYETSVNKTQLPDWFVAQLKKLQFNVLEEKKREPSTAVTDVTVNSLTSGSQANLFKILKTVNSTRTNTSCNWLAIDDETQVTANQTTDLRANIANDIMESRRFEEGLKKIIENGADIV